MDRAGRVNGGRGMHMGILMGKPEAKGPLGRPRCRMIYNTRMNVIWHIVLLELAGLIWLRIGTSGTLLCTWQ
jgi:hypothetical protein